MGYNFAAGGGGDQVFLMPPDPREWLPEGHLAWAVRRQAAELDLAPFLAAYRADGQGNTAYHPRMMVALVIYCFCKGIRSSRAIEMATFDDVGARVICGGLHPDHSTNARFTGRHEEPLKGLLVQSLVACAREGLVRVDLAAEKDRLEARAAGELAKGQARVDRYAARAAAAAAGTGRRQSGRAPWPAERQRDVRASREAAARAARKLEEALADPAVAAAPDRPPKANTTDLASAVMPLKKGGFDQLYNLQALAGRGQVIVAIGTHDSTVDVGALHQLLAAGAANLAAAGIPDTILAALFDAGYASEANFTAPCQAELYVAVTRESRQTGKSAAGQDPAAIQSWQQMAARLETPEGQALYKQRKAIIEPVFAQLFARFGRALHYRGDMVDTEIHLWAAVHNILKAIRARARREQRERRAAARPAPTAA
jgi:transposase